IANIGRKHSKTTKDKISKLNKLRPPVSEETRLKLSLLSKGRSLSKEHRKKLSDSKKNNPKTYSQLKKLWEKSSKPVYVEGKRYNSQSEAFRNTGISIYLIQKNIELGTLGYKWAR